MRYPLVLYPRCRTKKNPRLLGGRSETNSWHGVYVWMIVYVGDWRTGAVAAEPPHRAGVYGPEAGTSHQAMPPHREGQAGVLPTVCYVAGVGGHGQKLHPILCINPVKHTVFYPWWLSYTGHSCTTWCWINKDMKWVVFFFFFFKVLF